MLCSTEANEESKTMCHYLTVCDIQLYSYLLRIFVLKCD